jgi:hypothetical protein
MAIDLSFPEEVTSVVNEVREFGQSVVGPCEKEIDANEGDRDLLVSNIIQMCKAAQEWGRY